MFSLVRAWTNVWVNNRDADYLRRHGAHYDVTVMNYSHSDDQVWALYCTAKFSQCTAIYDTIAPCAARTSPDPSRISYFFREIRDIHIPIPHKNLFCKKGKEVYLAMYNIYWWYSIDINAWPRGLIYNILLIPRMFDLITQIFAPWIVFVKKVASTGVRPNKVFTPILVLNIATIQKPEVE